MEMTELQKNTKTIWTIDNRFYTEMQKVSSNLNSVSCVDWDADYRALPTQKKKKEEE